MLRKIDPALLLALLIPVFAITPLVQQAGIPNLADGVLHVLRQVDFDRDLRDGALVPRWGADLYGGFGYPLYVFAPPLLAYGIEFFHLAGLALRQKNISVRSGADEPGIIESRCIKLNLESRRRLRPRIGRPWDNVGSGVNRAGRGRQIRERDFVNHARMFLAITGKHHRL